MVTSEGILQFGMIVLGVFEVFFIVATFFSEILKDCLLRWIYLLTKVIVEPAVLIFLDSHIWWIRLIPPVLMVIHFSFFVLAAVINRKGLKKGCVFYSWMNIAAVANVCLEIYILLICFPFMFDLSSLKGGR